MNHVFLYVPGQVILTVNDCLDAAFSQMKSEQKHAQCLLQSTDVWTDDALWRHPKLRSKFSEQAEKSHLRIHHNAFLLSVFPGSGNKAINSHVPNQKTQNYLHTIINHPVELRKATKKINLFLRR